MSKIHIANLEPASFLQKVSQQEQSSIYGGESIKVTTKTYVGARVTGKGLDQDQSDNFLRGF
jgi:hypothetical protein